MKKRMALIAALVGTGLVLSACGTGGNQTASGTETLTWLIAGNSQPDGEMVLKKANEILEKEIGAKIDIQWIETSAYSERMIMNMASGLDFDLCFTGYVNPYDKGVEHGGFYDITELLETETPALKASIPEYAWTPAKIKGKIYAVPNLQVYFNVNSYEIKKDLADKYGLDVSKVKRATDLEPFFEQIKANEPIIYPFRGNGVFLEEYFEEITSGIGILRDGSSKRVISMYEDERYLEKIRIAHEWYKKGYVREDIASSGDDTTEYQAGRYAVNGTSWKPGVEDTKKNSLGYEVVYANISEPYIQRASALLTMTAVGADSKNPVKALKTIEAVQTNKELYNLLSYGIEGTHYTLTEDGKVRYMEDSNYKTSAWVFGNQFQALLEEGQADDIWEETARLNETAQQSPIYDFAFNSEPVRSELSQISTIIGEYQAVMKGSDPLEKWHDTFISRLYTAGYQKVMDEVQRQLDEYFASK